MESEKRSVLPTRGLEKYSRTLTEKPSKELEPLINSLRTFLHDLNPAMTMVGMAEFTLNKISSNENGEKVPEDLVALLKEIIIQGRALMDLSAKPPLLEDNKEAIPQLLSSFLDNLKEETLKFSRTAQKIAEFNNQVPENSEIFLRAIAKDSERIADMVDNPLVTFEIENGIYQGEFSKESFENLTDDAARALDPLIEKKGISFDLENEKSQLGKVIVDKKSFSRLLSNVLKNAAEASPVEGKIVVSSKTLEDQSIELCFQNDGEIPEKIRDKFWEIDVTEGKTKGQGLGTYIIKLIAEFHGGNVRFETGQGKTKIYINLPNVSRPLPPEK